MKNILIVGGGSAGVMSAYTIKKLFPKKNVTLIESKNISTVGVGESTLGHINQWLALMGISDEDFMKECNASYKMSIRFENFYSKKDGGFHYPFGQPFTKGNQAILNDWYFKKILYPKTPVSNYADMHYPIMSLVNENKILTDEKNIAIGLESYSFKKDVAYHFDATLFANWLKKKFIKIGGKAKIGNIVKTHKNKNGIEKVVTDKKEILKADLFIDCTGWKSLLLGEALEEPFQSYEDMLPNNSAWATKLPYTNKRKQLVPYTNCEAIENGWVWTIPLWSRLGTGYVYSDKYISDENALKQFKKHLGRDDLNFKKLKMRVGIHNQIFVKNVCAIGMAAGFIEPLESNGLLTVHEFLIKLVRILNRPVISNFVKQQFNLSCKRFFHEFAEFVAAHYALSSRNDTQYWKDIQNRKYKMEENFFHGNSVFQAIQQWCFNDFHYPETSGMDCIGTGMRFWPTDEHMLKYGTYNNNLDFLNNDTRERLKQLDTREKEWRNKVSSCPSLYDFLNKKYSE